MRRDTQWNKLQSTDFLTINEKRHAVGYGPIEGGDVLDSANKKPGTSSPAPVAPAQTPGAPLVPAPQSPFAPAPAASPNAWSREPKFNPYHDPDNGQFTFGPGDGDDSDEGNDSGGDNTPATPMDSHPGSRFFPGVDAPAKPRDAELVGDKPGSIANYSTPKGFSYGDGIQSEMGDRGWTPDLVDEAVESGNRIDAINKANGNPATRYESPSTGQSVIIDNVTNRIVQVGDSDFKFGPNSGDVPGAVMRSPPSGTQGGSGGGSPVIDKLMFPKNPWEQEE